MAVIIQAGAGLTGLGADNAASDLVTSAVNLGRASGSAGLLAHVVSSGAYLNKAGAQLASLSGSPFAPIVHS